MSLQYKPLFDQFVAQTPRPMSAYHFSSLVAWDEFFRFEFEVIEDNLCVFAFQGKHSFLYLPPLGIEPSIEVYKACFERMGRTSIARIENILDNALPMLKAAGYNGYLKAHEYVYNNTDLQMLAGHAYKSKRHDIHVFLNRYPNTIFRAFQPEDLEGCKKLYQIWASDRRSKESDPVYVQMLDENASVHLKLMAQAQQLGLIGRVVEIDGNIVGYTFGFVLNEQTFCVALEIVDVVKTGLAAFIFNQFCQDPVVRDFQLINTMDDFGMPNIAKAKMAYHPIQKLPVYNIKESA